MYNMLQGLLVPVRQTAICLASLLLFSLVTQAQNLTLSSGGQTGTSGTNWSTSGTNPITISVTGAANVNTSVIEGYLNAGTSVIVTNSTVGTTINSNITKSSGGNATLTIKDIGNIKIAANITISSSSNALDLILWADSDNSQAGTVDDFMYLNAGVTISTNGGKIVLAGGPDNGTNGGTSGDGIPDGFAWNGSSSVTYGANDVGGLTLGQRAGTGTVVSLLSGGGEIIMRGSTSNDNSYPGITSQANLKIVSGTGKITMYGKSTTGHGVELTYGAAPSIAISSAATSSPALDRKGTTSASGYAGFWLSNNANGSILFESTAASGGGLTIEGVSSSSSGLWFGVSNTNIITQLLSQSGPITLKGDGGSNASLYLYGDLYIGNRKDATAIQGVTPSVTASTANILIQADDQYTFSNTAAKNVNINTTGSLTVEAYTAAYSGTLSWTGNVAFGSNFSSIVLGESAENYTITLNTSLTSAGNITAYASDFNLGNGVGLTSSGAGNININARGNFGTTGTTRRSITTSNGNINVYADSDASGNGQLDIDYLTFNAGTGTTTVRTETFNWTTAANTDKPYINGTGAFVFEPADAAFGGVSTSWFYFDQDANGISGLTIGKSSNTGNITHETTAITVAGYINLYGGQVILNANLTSSATGDIFIKSNSNVNSAASLAGNASILKTAGTGTLTMQSQDRLNSGTVTASGSGQLNVILWSDYDNNNNGGVAINSITTNGGHLWLGGSNSNGGSYTWNGLTVGDGPSVGSVNNNHNAIDFYGPVSTSGGDVLVWGGDGYSGGVWGIGVYAGASINAGSGDIALIADYIQGSDMTLTTTGVLSLLPHAGSYAAAVTWSGSLTSGNFNATGTYDALIINSFANLGGLTIGLYTLQLSGVTPVIQGNSSDLTISSATSIAGPISFHGGAITVNAALTCTDANAAVLVKAIGAATISAGVTTNAGAINIWADSDSNGSGGILVNNNTTIDSRTSADRLATTHTTGGGTITLAGGADDGGVASGTSSLISGLVAGDGIPDGYAVNSGSLATQTGIVLGTSTAATGQNANVNFYSGSGHIRLFGKVTNNTSNPAGGPTGIQAFHGHTLNAGTNGDIILIGNADLTSGSTAIGMDLAAWRSTSYTANGTLRTANGNIRLIGRANGGPSGNLAVAVDGTTGNRNIFAATGSGTITFDGLASGASNIDCRLTSTDLLAASGDIRVIGQSSGGLSISNWIGDGLYLGQKAASLVTSSSSNITLRANAISTTNTLSVNSSGTLTVEPYGNSFSVGLSWPLSNTTLAGTVSGLTLGKSTNTATITLTAATTIAGPVTMYGSGLTINENLASSASGNISLYGNTLTVAAGKTISSAGTLIVEPQTNGTTIGIAGGAGTLSLPATYFSSNFSNGFSEIRIGNSNAGHITHGAALTLQDPLQLITGGNLILNENIILGSNDFVFSGGTISPATGKYIRSNGTGKLKMTIGNSASKTFPIGTSYYNPVTITNNTGASDQFYATVSDAVYSNGSTTGTQLLGAPRVDLTWNIGNTGASTGAGNVDLSFDWVPANNVTGSFISPKLLHHNGTTWDILAGTPSFNLVTGTLSYTGYSGSFSPFAIGETSFTLPVSWLSFTGTEQGKTVLLNWATASESNNDHFEIERSTNGMQYTTIGQVAAAANPAIRNDYQFTDINPLRGLAYYRLKQVDRDGRIRYSTVIAVNFTSSAGFELRVMPGSGLVGLTIPATISGKADVMIYDAQGRLLQRQTVVAGLQSLTVNAGSSNTMYLIKVMKDGRTLYTGRFML